jgi:hypothetical protein
MACFSTGCLCQLTPKYRPFAYTKWNHGFAIVEIDGDGSFEVNEIQIQNLLLFALDKSLLAAQYEVLTEKPSISLYRLELRRSELLNNINHSLIHGKLSD